MRQRLFTSALVVAGALVFGTGMVPGHRAGEALLRLSQEKYLENSLVYDPVLLLPNQTSGCSTFRLS